jgi:LemA protein
VKSKSARLKLLAVALLAPVLLAGCGVNTIPTDEELAKAKWADVQTQYQRRANLIPNLVATVQRYAQQEQSVLVQVTQARAQATHVSVDASTLSDPAKFQQYQQAQNQLSGVLGHLLSITENYPTLKSDENFLTLQAQLEGTENRIAIALRDYNEAVRVYNTDLHTFPGVIYAGTLYKSEKPLPPFEASQAAQVAPTVSFAPPTGAAPAAQ